MFRPQPLPPSKPDFCAQYISPQYRSQTDGQCRQGNYIKVWLPQNPYLDEPVNSYLFGHSNMLATHMQAAVYTRFFPDWMAKCIFGGVGAEDNLSWHYIWSALDQVVRGEQKADTLVFCMGKWSDGKNVKPISSVLPQDSVEDKRSCYH